MKGYSVLQRLTLISSGFGQLYQGRATLSVCNIVCSSRNLCQVQTVSCKPEVLCVTNNYSWKSGCRGNNDFFFFFLEIICDQILYWSKSLSNQKSFGKFLWQFMLQSFLSCSRIYTESHVLFLGRCCQVFPTLLWKYYSVGRVLSHNSMWIGPKIHKL